MSEQLSPEPILTAAAETPTLPQRPDPRHLDASERIALMLIGKLAEQNHLSLQFIAGPCHDERETLYWLFRDLADGVRDGLRAMDSIELEFISEGKDE